MQREEEVLILEREKVLFFAYVNASIEQYLCGHLIIYSFRHITFLNLTINEMNEFNLKKIHCMLPCLQVFCSNAG